MSRRASPEQQGELQGAIASLGSIAAIVGPAIMTGAYAHFSAKGAQIHFPGASFLLAGLLDLTGLALLVWLARGRPAAVAPARTVDP
jgi:DHA1 family tetracycline resistance protein-like MFS transporter